MGATLGTEFSPTWEFVVASRVTRQAHDVGLIDDLNGDGVDDVAVGAPGPIDGNPGGSVQVFMGSSSGIGPSAATTLLPPDSSVATFGSDIARAGDVNGDGFGDLVVTGCVINPTNGTSTRVAYLYLGAASGISSSPASTWTDTSAGTYFDGPPTAGAGDIDGDGYADVVVGSRTASEPVMILRGGPNGWVSTAAPLPSMEEGLGLAIAGVGDTNGDGYDDIVVSGNRVFFVYYGSSSGLTTSHRDTVVYPLTGTPPGPVARALGDINNDGLADMLVAGASTFAWISGSADGLSRDAAQLLPGRFVDASLGSDLTGDGVDDLVAISLAQPNSTNVTVFAGGITGPDTSAPRTFVTSLIDAGGGTMTGAQIAGGADYNGDGHSDIVVGAQNAIAAFYGGSNGLDPASSTVVRGVVSHYFGAVLASVDVRCAERRSL